ncbi:MAG: tRNA-binding protein [bacterium]|nr:tRNA-binding protein [bacterium]
METKEQIKYEDFAKLDFRIGVIKEVSDIGGADKLYKIIVNVGEDIQILSGIKESFTKEELVGKQIVVLVNLEPRKMKGEVSNGMLLAVEGENGVNLLKPENIANAGETVK